MSPQKLYQSSWSQMVWQGRRRGYSFPPVISHYLKEIQWLDPEEDLDAPLGGDELPSIDGKQHAITMKELGMDAETVAASERAFNDIKRRELTKEDLTEIDQQDTFNAAIADVLTAMEQQTLCDDLRSSVHVIYPYDVSVPVVSTTEEIQKQGQLSIGSILASPSHQSTTAGEPSAMQKEYISKAVTEGEVFEQDPDDIQREQREEFWKFHLDRMSPYFTFKHFGASPSTGGIQKPYRYKNFFFFKI